MAVFVSGKVLLFKLLNGPGQRLVLVEAVKCGGQMTSDPWDYEWRKAPMKKAKFIRFMTENKP